MVTVNVWRPQDLKDLLGIETKLKNFGHAAMWADDTYISYWPPKKDSKELFRYQTEEEDELRCRGTPTVVTINGLEAFPAQEYWSSLSDPYDEFTMNCCNVVASALTQSLVWTCVNNPEIILKFGKEMLRQLSKTFGLSDEQESETPNVLDALSRFSYSYYNINSPELVLTYARDLKKIIDH